MNSTILTSTSTPSPQNTPSRIDALDFLKCIFVLLMVAFHLAYFADAHPLLKQWVYTFHMPGFLLISGYLMRVDRPLRQFSRTLLWLFVPYLVLESSYIVASAFLPVRDGIAQLSLSVFAEKFFLHPLGPYWYLHTLILCGVAYLCRVAIPTMQPTDALPLVGFCLGSLSRSATRGLGREFIFLFGGHHPTKPTNLL